MNVLSNYTTNHRYRPQNLYRFPSVGFNNVVAFRNTNVPNFKSYGKDLTLKNRLYNEVQRLKNIHGYTIVFNLAMVGIAALVGLLGKFENSDYIDTLKSKIQNFDINNVPKEKITPDEQTVEEPQSINTEESITEDVPVVKPAHKKIVTNEDIQRRYQQLIAEKPERKEYFVYLEDYPELLKKYKNLIMKRAINESDKTNINNIRGFEKILWRLPQLEEGYYNAEDSEKDKKVNPVNLLNSLNTIYLKDFEDICSMFYKEQYLYDNNKNGRKIYNILDSIAERKFDTTVLKEYLKYPNLTYIEYISITECGREDLLQYFSDIKDDKKDDIKEKYNIQECRLVKSKIENNKPNFAIKFNSGISFNNRLKVIVEIFEKLHGKVTLHTGIINGNGIFNMANLFDELHFRLKKDNIITPLYNFAKFISPETLKEYNYTEDELNKISRPSEEDLKRIKDGTIDPKDKEKFEKFIELERKIGYAIAFLDDNEKCKEIIEVINDKEIFQNCIDNLHAVLRFICRFVINEKYNPENSLKEECKQKVGALKSDIYQTTGNSTIIQAYRYNRQQGIAPRFYFDKDCKLGKNISVTLNNKGCLHTIFPNLPINNENKCKEED